MKKTTVMMANGAAKTRHGSITGFSLIELLLVVLIFGITAAIVVPRLGENVLTRSTATVTAREIAGDMRLCRRLAITNASTNPDGFEIKMIGETAPYSGYQLIDRATMEIVSQKTFSTSISVSGQSTFRFGPLGNIQAGSGTTATVSGNGKTYQITLTPATGMVSLQE